MSAKTRVWLQGADGRMGTEIQKAIASGTQGFALADDLNRADVVIDFSTPDGNAALLKDMTKAKLSGKAVLIGTTGLKPAQISAWEKAAKSHKHRLLVAPNTSLGVLVGLRAALTAALPLAGLGFDVEIVETHHRMKQDAPSGTARFFADNIHKALKGSKVVTDRKGARKAGEIGVHAVRGGGVFGEHEIRIIGDGEELKISHRAFSRQLFATGALVLARWLQKQKPGVHRLTDVSPADL